MLKSRKLAWGCDNSSIFYLNKEKKERIIKPFEARESVAFKVIKGREEVEDLDDEDRNASHFSQWNSKAKSDAQWSILQRK